MDRGHPSQLQSNRLFHEGRDDESVFRRVQEIRDKYAPHTKPQPQEYSFREYKKDPDDTATKEGGLKSELGSTTRTHKRVSSIDNLTSRIGDVLNVFGETKNRPGFLRKGTRSNLFGGLATPCKGVDGDCKENEKEEEVRPVNSKSNNSGYEQQHNPETQRLIYSIRDQLTLDKELR